MKGERFSFLRLQLREDRAADLSWGSHQLPQSNRHGHPKQRSPLPRKSPAGPSFLEFLPAPWFWIYPKDKERRKDRQGKTATQS